MTGRCDPDLAQVLVALFTSYYGEHWCTGWRAHTREDGTPVIRCTCKTAIELGEAT